MLATQTDVLRRIPVAIERSMTPPLTASWHNLGTMSPKFEGYLTQFRVDEEDRPSLELFP